MYNRRLFMGGVGAAMGLAACGSKTASNVGQRSIKKFGLQTYSLREVFEPDPVGTLSMLKELGYDYVELNGRNFAERSTADLIAMVKDAGLYAPATHYGINGLREDFSQAVKDAQSLEIEYLIIPWLDEAERTIEGYKANAAKFNEWGRQAREEGFKLAYHNHQFEFDDLGNGVTGMNILFNETNPDFVDFELDLFWTRLAQVDIPALFKQQAGRFKLCHVKDMKGDPTPYRESREYGDIVAALMRNVGEGDIPFGDYFALKDVAGLDYFVLEHDNPPKPYKVSMKQGIDAARAIRF